MGSIIRLTRALLADASALQAVLLAELDEDLKPVTMDGQPWVLMGVSHPESEDARYGRRAGL